MVDTSKSPLDPRIAALLRAERAPSGTRERLFPRLAASLPDFGVADPSAGASGDPPRRDMSHNAASPDAHDVVRTAVHSVRAWNAYLSVVTAFVVGAGLGATLDARWGHRTAPTVVYVDRPVASSFSVSPPPASSLPQDAFPPWRDEASPSANGPDALLAPLRTPPSATERMPSASTRASQFAAERLLLDGARNALIQGDADKALERIARHQHAFPTPILGEERDALWIEALVKANRYDEARKRGEAFLEHHGTSLFARTVTSALHAIP